MILKNYNVIARNCSANYKVSFKISHLILLIAHTSVVLLEFQLNVLTFHQHFTQAVFTKHLS